ncbi:MAG: hypothetical protein EOO88_49660 [Pedobacter sp.]|nr:MAG: hypothetical protein EOO88_49660 [Pedobacter sp.]
MAELDAGLAKVVVQTRPQEMHIVPTGVAADKAVALLSAKQRVRDTSGKLLAKVEDEVSAGTKAPTKSTPAKSNHTGNQLEAKQSKNPDAPLKEKPAPLEHHDAAANTKKQDIAEPKMKKAEKRSFRNRSTFLESLRMTSSI